jgi:hypothetical protein
MNTKTRIGALAMVALMVAVAVPVAATESWSSLRTTWLEKKADFLNARADAIDAYATWLNDKNLANRTEVAIKYGAMRLAYLELVESGVNATRGLSDDEKAPLLTELGGYISTLQGYVDAISTADNARAAIKAAWDYWVSIRGRAKQISAMLIVARAEVVLWRCQSLAAKVEAKISQLQDNGVDNSYIIQLQDWLTNFDDNIALAQQKIDDAKAKVYDENWIAVTDNVTLAEMLTYVRVRASAASSYLKDAIKDLKAVLSDMRSNGYTVTLSGAGTLVASGSGTADISGTGVVKITAIESGVLTVSADVKNLKIDGASVKDNLDAGQLTYQGFSSAMVTGTEITVNISGSNITLYAHGKGTVTLTNWSGSYETYGENNYDSGTLTSAGATVTLETGVTG